jgi:hypothetical protein
MSKNYDRDISSEDRSAVSSAAGLKYNKYAGADKVISVDGMLERLPGINAVSDAGLTGYVMGMEGGVLISFFNTTASVLFVGFQVDGGVDFAAVAADSTNAIALRPNDYTTLVLPWQSTGVRASAAGVIPYLLRDGSKFVKRS